MVQSQKNENQKIITLTAITVFILLVIFGSVAAIAWQRNRTVAQFPGSKLVSGHSKYKLPKLYRWDDTYATDAPIDQVYGWYSIKFELGAEKHANGGCSLLEDVKVNFWAERYFGVTICEVKGQRMMFVTRATKLFP